jgi:hypothetical protein
MMPLFIYMIKMCRLSVCIFQVIKYIYIYLYTVKQKGDESEPRRDLKRKEKSLFFPF